MTRERWNYVPSSASTSLRMFFSSLSLFFPFLWPFRRHLQGQPTDVSTIWNAQQSTNSSAAVYVVKRTVAKHICQSCPVKMMTGLDRSLLPLLRKRIYNINHKKKWNCESRGLFIQGPPYISIFKYEEPVIRLVSVNPSCHFIHFCSIRSTYNKI